MAKAAPGFVSLALRQQAWQLGNVGRYPTRFILSQHLRYLCRVLCLSRIDVCERLAVSVNHLEPARYRLNRPWWWEASHQGGGAGAGALKERLRWLTGEVVVLLIGPENQLSSDAVRPAIYLPITPPFLVTKGDVGFRDFLNGDIAIAPTKVASHDSLIKVNNKSRTILRKLLVWVKILNGSITDKGYLSPGIGKAGKHAQEQDGEAGQHVHGVMAAHGMR